MAQTLEQLRAADAWKAAQGRKAEYKRLAKGLPALIIGSGLLQTLAFLHEKGGDTQRPHAALGGQLRTWLKQRYPKDIHGDSFEAFTESLLKAQPMAYQQITAEALAWLRWVRQMAAAAITEE